MFFGRTSNMPRKVNLLLFEWKILELIRNISACFNCMQGLENQCINPMTDVQIIAQSRLNTSNVTNSGKILINKLCNECCLECSFPIYCYQLLLSLQQFNNIYYPLSIVHKISEWPAQQQTAWRMIAPTTTSAARKVSWQSCWIESRTEQSKSI